MRSEFLVITNEYRNGTDINWKTNDPGEYMKLCRDELQYVSGFGELGSS
ncbi:MAG: hypothetical protein HRT74_07515 [Flavobacteriales bacterium]|nr:hypothetical protein [Flavobacteriales bacterium]